METGSQAPDQQVRAIGRQELQRGQMDATEYGWAGTVNRCYGVRVGSCHGQALQIVGGWVP